MKGIEMERTPKLKLSSVYGICAAKEFERRTDMEIANGLDIIYKVKPMVKALFEVTLAGGELPGYITFCDCENQAQALTDLLNITVTPYEFATLWNEQVHIWEEQMLADMCPMASVKTTLSDTGERLLVAWDDFGDLHLHTAWGIIAPSVTFSDPSNDENLKNIRVTIENTYPDVEFTMNAYDTYMMADALSCDGVTGNKYEMERIRNVFKLDEFALGHVRRLLTINAEARKNDTSDDMEP